jgi:hypothetical protein
MRRTDATDQAREEKRIQREGAKGGGKAQRDGAVSPNIIDQERRTSFAALSVSHRCAGEDGIQGKVGILIQSSDLPLAQEPAFCEGIQVFRCGDPRDLPVARRERAQSSPESIQFVATCIEFA